MVAGNSCVISRYSFDIMGHEMTAGAFGTYSPTPVKKLLLALIQNSKLRRGAFRPLMSRLMGASPIDTIYQGAPFRFHHRDSATERGALFNRRYNIDELDFLRQHTPVGGVFVDVGANAGTFAVVMSSSVGGNGRVIAIEPHPTAYDRLEFNANLTTLNNITLVKAAAGDCDGELSMSTGNGNLGASRISEDGIKIQSKRLITILTDTGIRNVSSLKIDVEGYEDKVLVPFFIEAPVTLWPRAIAIEHLERKHWRCDCINEILSRGYEEAGKTKSNTFLIRRVVPK